VNVSVSGGSPSYSYSWSGPNSYSSTQLNISGLATGTYTLTVTDSKGCTDVINAVVNNYPQILFTTQATNIACKGTITGSINLTMGGGTGSGFTYLWSGPNGMIATSEDLINLGTGNYNVVVTDIGSGCTVSGSFTITQPANAVNLSATSTNATGCNSLGTITVTGSGGTAPYQYSINGVDYQTSQMFGGLYAGSYNVWVKDANGCTKSLVKSITDNGQDEFESNNSKNQAKTIGLSVTNNARIATAGDAADWFKFTTTSAGSYTLMLTHPSATFTYNMYASGNNTPALVPTSTTATTKAYALAASTTYYISVTGGLSYVCYQFSVSPTSLLTKSSGVTTQQEVDKQVKTNDVFNVSAFPNPSGSYFNIKIETSKDEKANLRVMDITGKLIEERKNLSSNQIERLGDRYINGVYLVEVIQGTNRKTIRLVKM
jgi:Secretion system C-terminal sorting domain/SprB repeat